MKLLQVGKTKERFVEEAVSHYEKRLRKYVRPEFITVPPAKGQRNIEERKEQEEQKIREKLPDKRTLVLLDEKGACMTTRSFASDLQSFREQGGKKLCFVIGGVHGFSEAFKKEADRVLALSEMTLSHQVARIVFLEQVYRALSLLHGDPYHND